MRVRVSSVVTCVCGLALGIAFAAEAGAVSPRNPYRSFNLSGLNYGSMQWEKAQRQGKRVWPSAATSARGESRRGLFRRR